MITPKPHQASAIRACVDGLREPGSRGQCIMACGTGKTLVGFEVARSLKARRVLLLVPSLILVNQAIREYHRLGAQHFLAVCSDEDGGTEDTIKISVSELLADNSTDIDTIRAFVDGPGLRVVVSTYQSLHRLVAMQLGFSSVRFDLVIFDEAHKTAGHEAKRFAFGLSDHHLTCDRRLFLTATPRHARIKPDGRQIQAYAMNDPKIYGPVLCSLSLRAAIEAGIIDDYQIVVALVSKPVSEVEAAHALRVAIDRARIHYGVRKVFSYHNRVIEAEAFVTGARNTLQGMKLFHVNGIQSSYARSSKLKAFELADSALMSNARCLTEGVDLPAADMAALLVPKRSLIDIVQIVGRVLRKHTNKVRGGFVFLPVFVPEGANAAEAVGRSDWSRAYDVLQALREQDTALAAGLARFAHGDGEIPAQLSVMDARESKPALFMSADVASLDASLRKAIRVALVKPFKRNDPNGRKAMLLQMARDGLPRPKHGSANPRERSLAIALSHFTRRSCLLYDPIFDREIRALAPWWFSDNATVEEWQENIVAWVRKNQRFPSSGVKDPYERDLATRFKKYKHPRSKTYRAGFLGDVVAALDDAHVVISSGRLPSASSVDRIRQLLERAERGLPVPSEHSKKPSERSLAFAWRRLRYSSHPCVDRVRLLAPHWFKQRNTAPKP